MFNEFVISWRNQMKRETEKSQQIRRNIIFTLAESPKRKAKSISELRTRYLKIEHIAYNTLRDHLNDLGDLELIKQNKGGRSTSIELTVNGLHYYKKLKDYEGKMIPDDKYEARGVWDISRVMLLEKYGENPELTIDELEKVESLISDSKILGEDTEEFIKEFRDLTKRYDKFYADDEKRGLVLVSLFNLIKPKRDQLMSSKDVKEVFDKIRLLTGRFY